MKVHMNTERKTAAVLPFLLAFLLASCGRGEQAPKQQETTATALPDSSRQLLVLLPQAGEIPGWSQTEKPRFFGAGNLWEFINGAAEGYLSYGFEEVVSADYAQGKNQLVIDVFKMKDPTNAFGIYAQERNPGSRFVQAGVEGYLGGTTLNFWSGSHYVKITAFEENEALEQEMLKIAGHIGAKLPGGAVPVQIGWFPKADRIAHSARYIPKDVLGQSYFNNAFEIKYKAGSAEYKIILMQIAESAKEGFGKYRDFMSKQGRKLSDLSLPEAEEGFSGEDSFYGPMMAVRSGEYIAVILGSPSPRAGRAALAELLNNVKKAG